MPIPGMPPMPMPPPPPMGGMPPGGAPPGAPGGGAPPGLNPLAQMGLSAMDRLTNREPSGKAGLEQVKQALTLAQQLISAVLPMVDQWDPQVSKNLHVIGRQIADARIDLTKDKEPGIPPELLMGMGGPGPGPSPMGMPPGANPY